MPNLVKIGKTGRSDYKKRISDLNRASGVPVPFKAVHVSKVDDCSKVEKKLHEAFADFRVNPKREFFEMDEKRAIAILELVEVEDVTERAQADTDVDLSDQEKEARTQAEVMREKTNEEIEELRNERKRRPLLNFFELGIKENDSLEWKDDPRKFVTVCNDRKVVFEGVVMSLTKATQMLLGRNIPVQPSPYWNWNGRNLFDLYNEKHPIEIDEE